MERFYHLEDVSEITGIKLGVLEYLQRKGLLRVDIQDGEPFITCTTLTQLCRETNVMPIPKSTVWLPPLK